jgi:hypothetical protein
MNKLLLLFLLVNPFVLCAQNTYMVNLNDVRVQLAWPSDDFKICFVVDGRKDKASIGWVSTGLYNTTRPANFENPLDEEITNLFESSGILSEDTTAWIVLVSKLTVSELVKNSREVAMAEVGLHFFKPFGGDSCHFFGSAYGSFQQKGLEVTRMHPENIAGALQEAINTFKETPPEEFQRKPFLLAELLTEGFDVKDPASIAILNQSEYADGVYETFNDFLSNKSSFDLTYETDFGKTITLWRHDNGRKRKVKDGVVAFAKENKLYYLFDGEFYLLEKKRGVFHFVGPALTDKKKMSDAYFMGGVTGGLIAKKGASRRRVYRLDLDSGGAVEVGSIK